MGRSHISVELMGQPLVRWKRRQPEVQRVCPVFVLLLVSLQNLALARRVGDADEEQGGLLSATSQSLSHSLAAKVVEARLLPEARMPTSEVLASSCRLSAQWLLSVLHSNPLDFTRRHAHRKMHDAIDWTAIVVVCLSVLVTSAFFLLPLVAARDIKDIETLETSDGASAREDLAAGQSEDEGLDTMTPSRRRRCSIPAHDPRLANGKCRNCSEPLCGHCVRCSELHKAPRADCDEPCCRFHETTFHVDSLC